MAINWTDPGVSSSSSTLETSHRSHVSWKTEMKVCFTEEVSYRVSYIDRFCLMESNVASLSELSETQQANQLSALIAYFFLKSV